MEYKMRNVVNIRDVPDSWVYKYICINNNRKINQPFDGRTIKIKSFWTDEKTPSLCIYYDIKTELYKWKDYSAGKSGDAIELMREVEGITYAAACNKIMHGYTTFLNRGGEVEQYSVDSFISNSLEVTIKDREFLRSDLDFYSQWGITIRSLNKYYVKPFQSLIVKRGYSRQDLSRIYGFVYYKANGTPYQVYQPHNSVKYLSLNMDEYMIGEDQLTFKKPACGILSGLKDIMAMDELDLNSDYVASRSESIMLSANEIEFLKSKYKHLYCILDNDFVGIKYMKLYNKLYNIPFVKTGLSKDIALDRKTYPDSNELKKIYVQLINSKINAW